jgi:hypothetical protein
VPAAKWTCDASCNVQQIDPGAQCPARVTGRCQVWRLDTYRVQPTFQAEPSQPADEESLVLDHGLDWRQLRAATAEELLVLLFEDIERRLGVKVDRPAGSTSPMGSDQG